VKNDRSNGERSGVAAREGRGGYYDFRSPEIVPESLETFQMPHETRSAVLTGVGDAAPSLRAVQKGCSATPAVAYGPVLTLFDDETGHSAHGLPQGAEDLEKAGTLALVCPGTST
jgi:hypothetical protein